MLTQLVTMTTTHKFPSLVSFPGRCRGAVLCPPLVVAGIGLVIFPLGFGLVIVPLGFGLVIFPLGFGLLIVPLGFGFVVARLLGSSVQGKNIIM